MELDATSDDLARVALSTLGTDVLHARFGQTRDEDRRFFTGIEIAIIVGTQITISFWKGFFRVVRRRLGKTGEQLGEEAAEVVMDRLSRMLRLDATDKEQELPARARNVQRQLDKVVHEGIRDLTDEQFRDDLSASDDEQVSEIAKYLTEIGFRPDEADEHAGRLSQRIRQELD